MTDTPRTDAFIRNHGSPIKQQDFARTLERELGEAKADCAKWVAELDNANRDFCNKAIEVNQLRAERDAAQAALQIHDLALRDEIEECWKVLNFLFMALGNDGVETNNALSALARASALDAYRELKGKLK